MHEMAREVKHWLASVTDLFRRLSQLSGSRHFLEIFFVQIVMSTLQSKTDFSYPIVHIRIA